MAIFDIQSNQDAAKRMRRHARAQFFFNSHNPTDAYLLELDKSTERAVGERMSIVNVFEKEVARMEDDVDTSQWGHWEGTRNCYLNQIHEIRQFSAVQLPYTGTLSFDYVSPQRPKARDKVTSSAVVEEVIKALMSSECCYPDKVASLRGVSHLFVLSPDLIKIFVEAFPNDQIEAKNKVTHHGAKENWHLAKTKLNFLRSLNPKMTTLGSAFGFAGNPRVEVFVCLFNRCNRQPVLCTKNCLYDRTLFTNVCSRKLQTRLGRLRTFDAIYCCDPNTNNGSTFEMNLGRHEDWLLAQFLVILAAIEDGENMVRCSWTEKKNLMERGYDFVVPGTWLTEIPMVGTFKATYQSERPEYIEPQARQKCAIKYCGWEPGIDYTKDLPGAGTK